jgi:hypothetical protein
LTAVQAARQIFFEGGNHSGGGLKENHAGSAFKMFYGNSWTGKR